MEVGINGEMEGFLHFMTMILRLYMVICGIVYNDTPEDKPNKVVFTIHFHENILYIFR